MTGATLFSGGDLAGLGMKAAGINVLFGIEYEDDIAAVARANGLPVKTADMLDADPADFPAVDFLHASPPCPNFSVAKSGGEETENDLLLAESVCRFIRHMEPRYFTLENVEGYQKSKSWGKIARCLYDEGYGFRVDVIVAADVGVPQTRKRMFVLADRIGRKPGLVPRTHAKNPEPAGLFGVQALPWVGWYEAIEDLIPTLPESHLAEWQKARLPADIRDAILIGDNTNDTSGAVDIRPAHDPAFTQRTPTGGRVQRAVLIDPHEQRDTVSIETTNRDGHRPSMPVKASMNGMHRALISRQTDQPPRRGEPAFTVTGSYRATETQALLGYRVVQMTPRALARFQSIPDTYMLPEKKSLACRIIGNAVPPLVMQRIVEHLTRNEAYYMCS